MSSHLVVASKVKSYIKNKANMSTSSSALEALTKIIEKECDRAINNAQINKRKTVMDRDFNSDLG